jgi:hypothetical protein
LSSQLFAGLSNTAQADLLGFLGLGIFGGF